MKRILLVAGIIVMVIIIWKLYPTEEKRLRKDINTLRAMFENENTAEVARYIDTSYLDLSGLSYDDITTTIGQFFEQVDSIKVQMSSLKLSIDSVTEENVIYASCSLGLRVLARYEGERVLAFGGIVKPNPVKAFFRKSGQYYTIYKASY